MSLKTSLLQKIKKNKILVRDLEDHHHKSFYTIQEWLKNNHPLLSTDESLIIIADHLGMDWKDIIE